MMNITNYPNYNLPQVRNSNLNFKGYERISLNCVDSFISKQELNIRKLQKKHFNAYSTIDKILIKLNLKKDLSEDMAILDHLGTDPWLYKGKISIRSYGQEHQMHLAEMGLDENKVLDNVTDIRCCGDFRHSKLKDMRNIERIGKNLYLNQSGITDLRNLKIVDRHVYLNEHLSKKDFANVEVCGCILR